MQTIKLIKNTVLSVLLSSLALSVTSHAAIEDEAFITDGSANSENVDPKNISDSAAARALIDDKFKAIGKADANGLIVNGTAYISDKTRVWTRRGPGTGYRIIGSLQVGDRVIFKRYSDNKKFAEVEFNEQLHWIPTTALQGEICGYNLAYELGNKINDLSYKLDNYDSDLTRNLKSAQEELTKLKKENAELKSTLSTKESTIQELEELHREYAERLQTRDLDMQMRWWGQGALIAFAGAIAGVIFVFIPRPSRKQRRDRY